MGSTPGSTPSGTGRAPSTWRARRRSASLGVAILALASSIVPLATSASAASKEPWAGATTVGFITVGANTDEGYNEAVYTASETVQKQLGRQGVARGERPRNPAGNDGDATDG